MSILQAERLIKKFGQYYALSNISLKIEAGEVHALVGENGAGKSTFIKIITGIYHHDGGQIYWLDKETTITNPKDARDLGINAVHQDRHLIPYFTGYENLYLGLSYPKKRLGFSIDWGKMKKKAEKIRLELGVQLNLNKTVTEMTPPERTMLEILRAMMLDCRLLILDEPTASLTDQESELLFQLIQRLTKQGIAILYVSHRLDEIFRIADCITVLQNGRIVATKIAAETNKQQIINMMTQGEIHQSILKRNDVATTAPAILELTRLTTVDQRVKNVNLIVREGEIVGVFGLSGSGRTEMLEAIYGSKVISQGDIKVSGEVIKTGSPKQSLKRGIVLIPEDRRGKALIMNMTIRENMTLSMIEQFSNGVKMASSKEKSAVVSWMNNLKVKATTPEQKVQELSGGNQQKVVFAKALLAKPVLFLCDEPTQAVDVMTRGEIHRLLKEQTKQQKAVLYVSSDLQEILDISDRIYVFHNGTAVAEMKNEGITSEEILQICFNQENEVEMPNG